MDIADILRVIQDEWKNMEGVDIQRFEIDASGYIFTAPGYSP